jgi:single-strand DNA-binding protein
MPNFNRVIIAGHLGGNPETKESGPTRFSIAVNDRWKDASDQPQERLNWFQVVAWNGLADSAKRLSKGDGVLIEGALRYSEWEDEETKKTRSRVEIVASNIVFLGKKRPEQTEFPPTEQPAGAAPTPITSRRRDRKQ